MYESVSRLKVSRPVLNIPKQVGYSLFSQAVEAGANKRSLHMKLGTRATILSPNELDQFHEAIGIVPSEERIKTLADFLTVEFKANHPGGLAIPVYPFAETVLSDGKTTLFTFGLGEKDTPLLDEKDTAKETVNIHTRVQNAPMDPEHAWPDEDTVCDDVWIAFSSDPHSIDAFRKILNLRRGVPNMLHLGPPEVHTLNPL